MSNKSNKIFKKVTNKIKFKLLIENQLIMPFLNCHIKFVKAFF